MIRYCYCLFCDFWKIAPGPSRIAPGAGKIPVNQEQLFQEKNAPGSRALISRLVSVDVCDSHECDMFSLSYTMFFLRDELLAAR